MEEKVLIVKYGEVFMRGNNRFLFIKKLVEAIRKNIDPLGAYYVEKEQGRLIVESRGGPMDFDRLIPRITCIFGLIGVCPGLRFSDQSIENVQRVALEHIRAEVGDEPLTFKVNTRRADKHYPLVSQEVSALVGEHILDALPNLTVDVHHPQLVLNVELRNQAYIYSKIYPAFGGLPAGSSGKAVALVSGGFDSPVAAWTMAKRGVEVVGVYFHSPPYTGERAKQKVIDLCKRLSHFTGGFRLYIVNFTELQLYLLDNTPHDKLTIFLKRAMMRAGESIAAREHALGLITGDSVGQVASQTMEGLAAINDVCHLPVSRPLCGMDKQEIMDQAERIGTYDISIQPYEDCCTIFVAKHPETRPRVPVIRGIEKGLPELDGLLKAAVLNAEVLEL